MAAKKITELKNASTVTDSDILLVVQDGETKKTSAGNFIKRGQEVNSAKTLGGYLPEEFLKKTETAADSQKLGGISADQYMKKSDSPGGGGSSTSNPFWWTPIPYILPDEAYKRLGYIECDGSLLSKEDFPELYEVLGDVYNYEGDTDRTKFRIPNLKGRVLVGKQVAQYNEKTAIPSIAGKYTKDRSILPDDPIYKDDVQSITDEITKQAYLDQMHRLKTEDVPMHAHTNGVSCVQGGYDELIMPYGFTSLMDDGRRYEYPYNHRVEGTTSGFDAQRMGYSGYAVYKYNDINEFTTTCDSTHPNEGFNIVQPGLSVTWVMKIKP